MDIHACPYRYNSLPWFVEFVGPGSSGKTTVLECLKKRYGHEFTHIGTPDLTRISRVKTRLREELFGRRALYGYHLDAFSRKRLIKGFAKVTGALGWYAKCRDGIYLVDEGPFRVIMDYAAHGEIQYQLWQQFCFKALHELSRYRVLLVFVEAAPAVRVEREKHRKGVARMVGSTEGYPIAGRAGKLPTKRWYFREEVIRLLESKKYNNFHSITLINDSDVEEVAFRARHLIHERLSSVRL